MADSEDEFRPPAAGAPRRKAAALAAEGALRPLTGTEAQAEAPPGPGPGLGLGPSARGRGRSCGRAPARPGGPAAPSSPRSRSKRAGASAAEPSAKRVRRAPGRGGAAGPLPTAAAGGVPRRTGRRARARAPRSPPPLLLQDPEEARRDEEARAAMLLAEAAEFPQTPPLSASRLAGPGGARGRSLWELSASAEPRAAPGSCSAEGFALPASQAAAQSSALSACLSHSGHVRSPQFDHVIAETEPFRDRACGELLGSLEEAEEKLACSQNDAAALEDLMELASEGLTLTQWGLEAQQLQGAEQDLVLGKALESRLVQCLEKRPPPRSCHQEVPLGLLAAAFRGMVNNPHLSDVQFQVDSGELFYAHTFVLYARCPQLLEMVDSQGFTVAEDGGAATCRVLLREVRAEAVQAFLNYLYAADHAIPHCLLPDVAALAARYGVRELAALCHGQSGLASTAGEEEEEEEDTVEEKDRAETFEELLRSMWQDEEDGALSKGIHPDNANSTGDLVSEPELEEIYGFAATQRAAVPGGTALRQRASQPVPGESCPRTDLEEATPKGSRREWKGGRAQDAPSDASGEGMRRRLPLAARPNTKEGRSLGAAARRLSPAEVVLGLAEVSEEDDCPALPESLASVTLEGSPGSPGAGEQRAGPALQDTPTGHPPSPLQGSPEGSQRALGMLSRNPHAPVLPLVSSPLLSPPSLPSHICSLDASPSQLPATGRCSSVQASEQEGAERSDGVLGSSAERPLDWPRSLGHSEADPIVVLDSDEEVEPKEEVCPGLDGLWLGPCKRRRGSGVGCCRRGSGVAQGLSPLLLQGMGAPGLAVPVGDEAGSPQAQSSGLWGWSSSPEEDTCSKGGMLLVPDTPPLSRERAVPSSRPQSKERPPTQSSPPLCNRPFPPHSATHWLDCSPSWLPPEVVVLDDSEEEQEAALPCPAGTAVSETGLPSWEEVVGGFLPFVGLAGARSSLGGALQMGRRKTEGRPWVVGPAAAGGAASSGSGVATSMERTPCQQEWAEDLDSSQAARPATRELPALEPAGEAACDLACWTPLTPAYSIMETPKLKKELRRFGVRPLPKRQMVLKLKEIFRYTHSKVGADCTAQAVSPQHPRSHNPATTESRTEASSTHQKQLPRFQQMFPGSNSDPSGGGGDQRSGHMVEPSGAGSGQPKSPTLPAAAFSVRHSCRLSPMASQESTGSSVTDSEASVTSQSSSSTGFESSSLVLAEQEHLPVSQAAACETLKLAALQCYLCSNPAFLRQILMYQPIELAVLQAELKQNGIGIAMGKLLDFLDVLCITFTTAEARREKQHRHGSKRKGRQRY